MDRLTEKDIQMIQDTIEELHRELEEQESRNSQVYQRFYGSSAYILMFSLVIVLLIFYE